ncbi:MAG: hypothetical protein BRD57_00775, partial [Proteobacteria bacterium SW_6_67_9]
CVHLFGSRVNDQRRGGDIDLYIEASEGGHERVRQLRHALLQRLGYQRIDIVTAAPGGEGRPIDARARAEGIVLDGIDP